MVLLEVQMHPDTGFHHRLAAQTCRFLQQHPRVEHWAVLVITPHNRLNLGPNRALRLFLQQVAWINLLTLPIRPESELATNSKGILASRPDLDAVVLSMLMERFPELSREDIMVIAGIPHEELRHTRAAQEWLAEGRQEGLQEGRRDEAAAMALRLLNRRCGPLTADTTSQIQALLLEQLEALADALLDFQGPADLAAWLAANAASPA